jgi:UDP-hydrolysing UDP-N-acetyl-D-glucosamine 2-epimerase
MSTGPRRICVVTGSRADYGLLRWLMEDIRADPSLRLQVLATGAHLSPRFGLTVKTIEADGFLVDERVVLDLDSDHPLAISRSMGAALSGIAEALDRLAPEILVVLGDRTEILAAAAAALSFRIPVAHIHGGELSAGAIDDAIRHAVTKLSHLHFVAAEPYRARVVQLGEEPDRVWTVGAVGLDALRRLSLLSRAGLEQQLGFLPGERFLVVTCHPATLSAPDPAAATEALLAALDEFPDLRILFTQANADAGGSRIDALVGDYCARHPERARRFDTLGQLRYLSALRWAEAVVGNSSSGLIEAPALRTPTVNVGDRQRGRLQAASVIQCSEERSQISGAIRRALSAEFRATLAQVRPPYGDGDASRTIKEHLARVPLEGLALKVFQDSPQGPA